MTAIEKAIYITLSDNLNELIDKFNKVVARLNKAEDFFNNPIESEAKKDRFIKTYSECLMEANVLAYKIIPLLGREITNYESLNGINI